VVSGKFDALELEAKRQLDALPDGAILEWHVTDAYGAAAVRDFFERAGLDDQIEVVFTPRAA